MTTAFPRLIATIFLLGFLSLTPAVSLAGGGGGGGEGNDAEGLGYPSSGPGVGPSAYGGPQSSSGIGEGLGSSMDSSYSLAMDKAMLSRLGYTITNEDKEVASVKDEAGRTVGYLSPDGTFSPVGMSLGSANPSTDDPDSSRFGYGEDMGPSAAENGAGPFGGDTASGGNTGGDTSGGNTGGNSNGSGPSTGGNTGGGSTGGSTSGSDNGGGSTGGSPSSPGGPGYGSEGNNSSNPDYPMMYGFQSGGQASASSGGWLQTVGALASTIGQTLSAPLNAVNPVLGTVFSGSAAGLGALTQTNANSSAPVYTNFANLSVLGGTNNAAVRPRIHSTSTLDSLIAGLYRPNPNNATGANVTYVRNVNRLTPNHRACIAWAQNGTPISYRGPRTTGGTDSNIFAIGASLVTNTWVTATPEQMNTWCQINVKNNTTNTITFEHKVTNASGSILTNWSTSTAAVVPSGGQLHFRWNATDYTQCLPFFNDNGRYAFAVRDYTMVTGNTETSGYNVPEVSSGTYRLECGGQKNGEIGVDARELRVNLPTATSTFSVTPASGAAPLKVRFTGLSGGVIIDLGNGSTMSFSDATPSYLEHTYTTAGSYTATLKGAGGTLIGTTTISVASTTSSGNFSVTPTSGTAPLRVTASINGDIRCRSYTLTWGDGTNSNYTHPSDLACTADYRPIDNTWSHTYAQTGIYTVRLQLNGAEANTKTVTVSATSSNQSYDLDDIRGIQAVRVDFEKNTLDEEVTFYTITLENNVTHEVRINARELSQVREQLFRNTGYTGSVSALISMAAITQVRCYDTPTTHPLCLQR